MNLAVLAAKLSYKKNWKFASHGYFGSECITVCAKFEDVNNPGTFSIVTENIFPMEGLSEELVIRQIYNSVMTIERHETSEWFKVDGQAIYNEHDLYPEKFR